MKTIASAKAKEIKYRKRRIERASERAREKETREKEEILFQIEKGTSSSSKER
jgi:hypothetical protein